MKKLVVVLLTLALAASLVACGNAETGSNDVSEENAHTGSEQETAEQQEINDEQQAAVSQEEEEKATDIKTITFPRPLFSGTVEEITEELEDDGIANIVYDEDSRTFTGVITEEAREKLEKENKELFDSWTGEELTNPESDSFTPIIEFRISDDYQSVEAIADTDEMSIFDSFVPTMIMQASVHYQLSMGIPLEEVDCTVSYVNLDGLELARVNYKEWAAKKNEEAKLKEQAEEEPEIVFTEVKAGETIVVENDCEMTIQEGYKTGSEIVKDGMMTGWTDNEDNTLLWVTVSYKNLATEEVRVRDTIENPVLIYDGEYTYEGKWGLFGDLNPLTTNDIYPYFEIPKEIANDDKPLEFTFEHADGAYSYILR